MLREKIKNLPQGPGVYLMKSKEGKILYVGKASCLRKRVDSYLSSFVSPKIEALLKNVADLDIITCDTEEQALILEAALIKERKPKYNVVLRDDKSYPYIRITREKFPAIFIQRPKKKTQNLSCLPKQDRLFGPYPKVKLVKSALNMIRRIFPFRSCKKIPKKPCLFYHLHLCPAVCKEKVTFGSYRENIRNICKVLGGERRKLLRNLEKKMQDLAGKQEFEGAAAVRDKLLALYKLYEGKGKCQLGQAEGLISSKEILNLPFLPLIIEAIDVSCLSQDTSAASVVVFKDGVADKSSYRKFKIKEAKGRDDYAMIGEVVRRRYSPDLKREERRLPDLIIIDGGRAHVKRAKEELDRLGVFSPVIGIAKRNEEVWFASKNEPLIIPSHSPCLHLIQRVRDEAHRFAHKYHLFLRRKKILDNL